MLKKAAQLIQHFDASLILIERAPGTGSFQSADTGKRRKAVLCTIKVAECQRVSKVQLSGRVARKRV